MKKIACLLLLVLISFSICACTVSKEITRYEEQQTPVGGRRFFLSGLSNETILDCYFDLLENDTFGEMYLPMEGSFTAEDGTEFVSVVKEKSMVLSTNASYILGLSFTLEIYSMDNQLILSEEIRCKELRAGDALPEPDVSDEMAKYWSVVKVPAGDYDISSREVQ